MHAFGLLTSASTLAELDQMLLSCTVLFSSPCSSENVEKHFRNLQTMLTAFGASPVNDSSIVAEDFEVLSKLTRIRAGFGGVRYTPDISFGLLWIIEVSGITMTTRTNELSVAFRQKGVDSGNLLCRFRGLGVSVEFLRWRLQQFYVNDSDQKSVSLRRNI
ncbi:hypothetical protein AOLI_G00324150 [Acnodon oligacanthus]